MDLKHLTYIVTIAELGNLSHAARALYVSQPALSLYLSRLEDSLGLKLFERKKSALVPTQAGLLYVDAARRILAIKDELYIKLDNLSASYTSTLELGIVPLTCSMMLSTIYAEYKAQNPHVRIQITENNSHALEQLLREKKIRIAFLVYAPELSNPDDLICRSLRSEPFYLGISEKHPSAALLKNDTNRPVSLQDFSGEPFILSPSGTIRREIEDTAFHASSVNPVVLCEINNVHTTKQMVANNNGVAFFARGYIKDGDPILYLPIAENPHWHIGAAYLKSLKLTTNEKHFLLMAEQYYQTHTSYL